MNYSILHISSGFIYRWSPTSAGPIPLTFKIIESASGLSPYRSKFSLPIPWETTKAFYCLFENQNNKTILIVFYIHFLIASYVWNLSNYQRIRRPMAREICVFRCSLHSRSRIWTIWLENHTSLLEIIISNCRHTIFLPRFSCTVLTLSGFLPIMMNFLSPLFASSFKYALPIPSVAPTNELLHEWLQIVRITCNNAPSMFVGL